MNNFSIEKLREYIKYIPKTGEFIRIKNPARGYQKLNIPTKGTKQNAGYYRICVLGKVYPCNVLAMWLYTGKKPILFLDHINRDRGDNRIDNLREVSRSQNGLNQNPVNRKSYTGVIGVYKVKKNTYKSLISVDKKQHYLGTFKSIADAQTAYLDAKVRLQSAGFVNE